LTIDVVPEGRDLLPEHHATAARLLRDAADRIERGDDLGGFYYSPEDSFTGGFALYPVK
jgi:hypothetical protein